MSFCNVKAGLLYVCAGFPRRIVGDREATWRHCGAPQFTCTPIAVSDANSKDSYLFVGGMGTVCVCTAECVCVHLLCVTSVALSCIYVIT